MKIRTALVLLLLPILMFVVSGCAATCFGKLDRDPAPGASILVQDPAGTCPISDSTPHT
jgi:hypothetical protein